MEFSALMKPHYVIIKKTLAVFMRGRKQTELFISGVASFFNIHSKTASDTHQIIEK